MATERDIAQVVSVIATAYPNWQPAPNTPELYFKLLGDIPTDELKAAVLHCVAEAGRKFAPSIGEIRGAVGVIRTKSTNLPSAYEAWQEVITQIRDNGGDFGKPVWSNPLVERAVRSIGWRELRFSENQAADRARFIQCYEQLTERATQEDIMLPEVRGFIEANGGRLLAPADQIHLLADKLNVRK